MYKYIYISDLLSPCYFLNAFHIRRLVCIASDKIDRVSELGRLDKIAYDEARLWSAELSHSLPECVCVLISAGRRKFIPLEPSFRITSITYFLSLPVFLSSSIIPS